VEAAKAAAEMELAALRKQLDLECKAHTQTQHMAATGQDHYQETVVQMQRQMQELHGLSGELEVARSSQRDSSWKMTQLHNQMKAVELQK
jgi:hypothetical protein